MKKFFIAVFSVIIGTTGVLSLLQPTNYDIAKNNLSEIRYNLFQGKTEQMNATLMSGLREEFYSLDGTARSLIEFGVITVTFLTETTGLIGKPRYSLTVDDVLYEGLLEKDPFKNNYVADIKKIVPDEAQVYLAVEWDTFFQTVKLDPISVNWQINWENALKIAVENVDIRYFNSLILDGKFFAEVHIQMMGDPTGAISKYYWHVNIYGKDGSIFTVIIDPDTGEVMSSRVVR